VNGLGARSRTHALPFSPRELEIAHRRSERTHRGAPALGRTGESPRGRTPGAHGSRAPRAAAGFAETRPVRRAHRKKLLTAPGDRPRRRRGVPPLRREEVREVFDPLGVRERLKRLEVVEEGREPRKRGLLRLERALAGARVAKLAQEVRRPPGRSGTAGSSCPSSCAPGRRLGSSVPSA